MSRQASRFVTMKNKLIAAFEDKHFAQTKQHPTFRVGDTVRVNYKLQEGADKAKFRIQQYEGVVIRFRRGTVESSFVVRKIGANSVGVERNFPLYSPYIDSIDLIASGIVRRARLYYLRDLQGKAARIRSRQKTRKAVIEVPGSSSVENAAVSTEA